MTEPDADVAAVRAACLAAKDAYPGSSWNDADGDPIAALDRLAARLQEAERNRRQYEIRMTKAMDERIEMQKQRDSHIAREAALREALAKIEGSAAYGSFIKRTAHNALASDESGET